MVVTHRGNPACTESGLSVGFTLFLAFGASKERRKAAISKALVFSQIAPLPRRHIAQADAAYPNTAQGLDF